MPSGGNKKSPSGGGGASKGRQQPFESKKSKSAAAKANGNDKVAATVEAVPADEDINSGFGQYLRSPQAIEMMRLFVIANTLVVILTMAWPQMKQSYQIILSLFAADGDEDDF
ncbi:uncharacterized protein LOC129762709 isoform X2 [Toxorhynchites rutilus septentrionalis]|nr:uncharacterized protein LOC129762709 isoform X2 [Toxorhynchites rutilus septentrionalis]